jgi:heavy metal sensor kinase
LKNLSIQARLTAWYLLSLSIIVGLFAGGSWFAMRASMYRAIDRDLSYRMRTIAPFIESRGLTTHQQFERDFVASADSPVLGVFVQITDEHGEILFQSDVLQSHRVPAFPAATGTEPTIGSLTERGWPVRFISRRVTVAGTELTIHVVEPLRDLLGAIREYQLYLMVLIPIALVLTTTAGYWLSRRALAPVEQIRQEAEAVDPADLAARLRVPQTDDEVMRLAQTLNAMLTRIESGFRSIERFTADASHELRAPLALITTAAEVSLRRERTAEELKEVLCKIVREARHMAKLVENLLDLARGDARQRHMEMEPVDLAGMLRELDAELQPAAEAKGLALRAEVPEGDVCALGESTQLRRLFLILIDNAIKYTEQGSVRVGLGHEGGEVVVRVVDTGIGIEKDAVGHVFDRFWRADKVRSRAEGGAGLGLSLAAQIVQRHGGTISVGSEVGKGSEFMVRLKGSERGAA